jgi:hypothetical protein
MTSLPSWDADAQVANASSIAKYIVIARNLFIFAAAHFGRCFSPKMHPSPFLFVVNSALPLYAIKPPMQTCDEAFWEQ